MYMCVYVCVYVGVYVCECKIRLSDIALMDSIAVVSLFCSRNTSHSVILPRSVMAFNH